jgi:hypothetical protein
MKLGKADADLQEIIEHRIENPQSRKFSDSHLAVLEAFIARTDAIPMWIPNIYICYKQQF